VCAPRHDEIVDHDWFTEGSVRVVDPTEGTVGYELVGVVDAHDVVTGGRAEPIPLIERLVVVAGAWVTHDPTTVDGDRDRCEVCVGV
jgi:hypothetical protein